MASSSRRQTFDVNAVLEAVLASDSEDENRIGMDEDEEYDLDRQMGFYSDESR